MCACAQILSNSTSRVTEETTVDHQCKTITLNGNSPRHQCVATLRISTPHMISCLAVHNNLLYAASINGINVFDLSNYSKICTFSNNSTSGSIKSIAFTKTKIFTAHQDCKIRVWKTISSKEHRLVSTLPTVRDRLRRFIMPRNYVQVRRHRKKLWIEHYDVVSALVVMKGLIYSVSWDTSLKIWNASNHQCLESIKAHEDAINAIAISDNGTVYTASADGRIRAWQRAKNGSRKHILVSTLEKHKSSVNALVLNNDGSILFSGGRDRSIKVWEINGSLDNHMVIVETLLGHNGAILCLTNIQDLLVSGSSDRTVRIWQRGIHHGYCCTIVMEGHENPVKSLVAVSSEDVTHQGVISICSGSLDGEIKIWQVSRTF